MKISWRVIGWGGSIWAEENQRHILITSLIYVFIFDR